MSFYIVPSRYLDVTLRDLLLSGVPLTIGDSVFLWSCVQSKVTTKNNPLKKLRVEQQVVYGSYFLRHFNIFG